MGPIRIELPATYEQMTVNSWLFTEPEPVLVDCGEKTEKSWRTLTTALAENGLTITDITRVYITHAHMDHMGMASEIARQGDAEIWLPEYAYDWAVALKFKLTQRSEAFEKACLEYFPNFDGAKIKQRGYDMLSPYWDEISPDYIRIFPMQDAHLEFGGRKWEIIYTPGHCINQICFFDQSSGELLSADMLLHRTAIPLIDAHMAPPFDRTRSLVMMMDSYRKLQNLPIKTAYPGHLDVFSDVSAVINRQMESIRAKKDKILRGIARGKCTFQEIRSEIYPRRMHVGTFLMTLGMLDLLKEEGAIAGSLAKGQLHYRLRS